MNYHRVPIAGWKKCVYEAAMFDTLNEGRVALLLDDDGAVEWWLRNDPPQFHIPTPAGRFEPDFVYAIRRGGELRYGVIEVKGRVYWNGPESESRIKARTFRRWCEAVAKSGSVPKWEFAVVWDEDVPDVASIDALRGVAQEFFP